MHREAKNFYALAKAFLSPTAEDCLDAFANRLRTIQSRAPLEKNSPEVVNKKHTWSIPAHMPLLTKPSREFEPGKPQGRLEVVGRLTATWEVTSDPKKNNQHVPKHFRLSGNASVLVEWIDQATDKTIGHWHVDVADSAAPGCMFHVQVPNQIPVPRHPCLVFTPLAVAEFVLGELFQTRWSQVGQAATGEWLSELQRRRLLRMLDWQRQVVKDSVGLPLATMKRERIGHDRFVAAQ
jgi:hypothetical protein